MISLGWPMASTEPGRVHREWLRRAAHAACALPPADLPEITTKRAVALVVLGEPEGWAVAETLSDEVETPRQRLNVTLRDRNLGHLAMRWGRFADARARLANALDLAEKFGYPREVDYIKVTLVHLDWLTGNWTGLAERAAERAAAEDSQPLNRAVARLVIGLLATADGQHAEAEGTLRDFLAEARTHGAVESMAEPAAALARLHLTAGRPSEALRVTEEPIGVIALKETWLWAVELVPARLDALFAAGRDRDAVDLLAAFAQGVRGRGAPAARAALTTCRAIGREHRGEHARAAALFARAAAAWADLPRPYDALLTRRRQGRCLLAGGAQEEGPALLAEVARGLTALGANGDADETIRLLRRHGVDARLPWRGGRRGYGDELSPRERDVVRLVAEGRTNREIAKALVISPKTVARHIDSATRKLGAGSRTELAVKVTEAGTVRRQNPAG